MGTFHKSTFHPTLKEVPPEGGDWYILLEPNEECGIASVDRGDRQVGIMLPKGASEEEARALRNALSVKGLRLPLIE